MDMTSYRDATAHLKTGFWLYYSQTKIASERNKLEICATSQIKAEKRAIKRLFFSIFSTTTGRLLKLCFNSASIIISEYYLTGEMWPFFVGVKFSASWVLCLGPRERVRESERE